MILGSGVSESTSLAQIAQRRRNADRDDAMVQAAPDSLVAVRVEIVTADLRKVVSAPARVVSTAHDRDAEPDSPPRTTDSRAYTPAPQEHAWASALLSASLLIEPPATPASDFGTPAGQRALAAYGLQRAIASHSDDARAGDHPRLSLRA